ncbi:MAG: TetR/AcrR family transcriptional regulator [Puniceicoccales bacterium]|jgi:AcrR family transcriptional regulator|nr:TetR/AcrR family transcriptional regulator [Puniceicoccales bacterium]
MKALLPNDTRLPSTTAQSNGTREHIIETAGALFAKHGRNNLSIRQITSVAEVNLAAINYHFGSKDGLFYTVCLHYLQKSNDRKIALLDAAEKASGDNPLTIEQILEAYIRPTVEMHMAKDPSDMLLTRLIVQEIQESDTQFFDLVCDALRPIMQRFLTALKKTFPECGEEDLSWGFLLVANISHQLMAETEKISRIFPSISSIEDTDALVRKVMAFGTAGVRTLTGCRNGSEKNIAA